MTTKGIMTLTVCIFLFSLSAVTTKDVAYGEIKVDTVPCVENTNESAYDVVEEIPFKEVVTTTTTVATTEPTTTFKVPETTTTKVATSTTTTRPVTTTGSAKKSYTDEELYMMSHLIYGEAGGENDLHQRYVGSVVLNRMNHYKYPNTMKGVIFQSGQYACTWDGNYNKSPSQQAIKNAKFLLEHGSVLPSNVVYQAQFKQGSGVYKHLGNTYFCYY